MSQMSLQFRPNTSPMQPHLARRQAPLQVLRVLLLRAPRISEETVIRDVRLHPGLNILWARNASSSSAPQQPAARLTGHSAGKTTFCRFIRYLLGEPRFGTDWLQEQVRATFPEGWVAGEVLVGGVKWSVGRPFGLYLRPCAARDTDVSDLLGGHEGYQEFLSAIHAEIVGRLRIDSLPQSGSRIEWLHVLSWLARDQETRFGGVIEWRAAPSESDGRNPAAADRSAVVRAVLDLMTRDEAELEGKAIEIAERRREIEGAAAELRLRADESRRQLAERMGIAGAEPATGPLSAHHLRAAVEDRREALARRVKVLEDLRAEVERAEQARSDAHEKSADARQDLGRAQQAREEQQKLAEDLAGATQAALLEDLPARPGRCNATAAAAKASGCRLFVEAVTPLDARRGQREAAQEAATAQQELDRRAAQVEEARLRVKEAKAEALALQRAYLVCNTAFMDEQVRVAKLQGQLDEVDRGLAWFHDADDRLSRNEQEQEAQRSALARLHDRRAGMRSAHAASLGRMSERFAEIVRGLLGDGVDGRVEIARDGRVVPRIRGRGELRGAAMDTVGVLAFDLTALALGIEGHGFFPGFLIHDGPREADLDLPIYEQLFRHAVQMERAFEGDPGFQYIVTTTTPPPEELQQHGRWLLTPVLDASTTEGRLLMEDL